jgi:hypothetical protein
VGDEVLESSRIDAVPAVGLESVGVTDRTDAILHAYLMGIDSILDQDPGRETRQVELESPGSAGHEELLQTLAIILSERQTDRIVDLVTAAAGGRPHCRYEGDALRDGHDGAQAGLDDASSQTPPAGVDRGHGAAVLRGDQDRNAIRSHDPDAEARDSAEKPVRTRPSRSGSRLHLENLGRVDLNRKDCRFGRLRPSLTKSVFDADRYENRVA